MPRNSKLPDILRSAPDYCESFPPIVTARSRVVILGSMPGVKSLAEQQYYAYPQNSFWKIMTALFDMPVATYPQRVALIRKSGLALWDVMQACERSGSLDSAIVKASIKPNDFAGFFKKYSKITHVFFNGGTAAAEFKTRVMPDLPETISARLIMAQLPSTSPAMASKNFAAKLKDWRLVKRALSD